MNEQQVSFAKLGDADLVRLVGEIDLANAPSIGREIIAVEEAGHLRRMPTSQRPQATR